MMMFGYLVDVLIDCGYDLLLLCVILINSDWFDCIVDLGCVDGLIVVG